MESLSSASRATLLQPCVLSLFKALQQEQEQQRMCTVSSFSVTKAVAMRAAVHTHDGNLARHVGSIVDSKGLVGDRHYMLVAPAPVPLHGYLGPDDATYRFLTQRQCPNLTRIVVQFSEDGSQLTFSSDLSKESCVIANITATVWTKDFVS